MRDCPRPTKVPDMEERGPGALVKPPREKTGLFFFVSRDLSIFNQNSVLYGSNQPKKK